MRGNSQTKDGAPILAWHLIQSFDSQVDPRIANEIGRKLAEELFGSHAVVISTHTNTENTHNHIEISAWNLDGRKWHQCNENYQKIRECSDRLCDEYGLSVLEHTRKQKLVKWQDEDGTVRYFEPTDRKVELVRKREAGELSPDDVNSYRNTIPYEVTEAKKQSNVETVRQAIDNALPYATSYEHLLMMLRELGFKIKDKKKNGDWLAHVTFTPPTAERGVRDSSIDKESGYYTRENLTAIIEAQNAERRRNEAMQSQLHLPVYDEYVYGDIDVQGINEDYRAERTAGGDIRVVQRGEAERDIIRDVKKSDQELYGLYDTTRLHRLIAEQQAARKRNTQPRNREEVLVRQIQESFDNLKFIERKQIYSYSQILDTVKGLWAQYNACLSNISEAERMISRLEAVAAAPSTLVEIKNRMEAGKSNPEYITEQYPSDVKLMKDCMEAMRKYNVTDTASLNSLRESIQKYREQISSLQAALNGFSGELAAYNRCVVTLARIDRDSGRNDGELMASYEGIVNNARQEAERTQEKKKERGRDR